jgi:hypothetical protein
MSQLEQEQLADDAATLADRLRPEEDPWSALAVADDDVLGDEGVPSPDVGAITAEAHRDADDAADNDTNDDAGDAADAPLQRDAGSLAAEAQAPAPRGLSRTDYDDDAADELDDDDADDVHASPFSATADQDEQAQLEEDDDAAVMTMVDPAVAPTRGGAFTIPMVCAGVAVIAACLLIPQADANRRLAYQQLKLRADLEAVERQVTVNEDFLLKVSDDPNLAERLAQRQMKIIRPGTKVLALKDSGEAEMSPFQITAVAPPPKMPPYKPLGGTLAQLCYNPKSRLYLIGVGLLLTAVGLVMGFGARSDD